LWTLFFWGLLGGGEWGRRGTGRRFRLVVRVGFHLGVACGFGFQRAVADLTWGPWIQALGGLGGQVNESLPAPKVQGLNPPSKIGHVPWPSCYLGVGLAYRLALTFLGLSKQATG
jgi:hypothetical protein